MKKYFLSYLAFFLVIGNISLAQYEDEEEVKTNERFEQSINTKGAIPAYDHNQPEDSAQNVFAKKVAEGTIELADMPLVIIYWMDWLTWLAGSLAVTTIVIGGYQYALGGVTDDKEKGRKTLTYAIAGLIVTFFSWMAVDFLQAWITSGLN